jgi:hypothetical protein
MRMDRADAALHTKIRVKLRKRQIRPKASTIARAASDIELVALVVWKLRHTMDNTLSMISMVGQT